jgi:ribonuclease HI/probable phosphoglycerate mutase
MTENRVDRKTILRVLADKLPDKTLNTLFPDLPPASVRDVLAGRAETAAPPARQQNLFSDTQTTGAMHCRLYTDGASRGNPGEAGAGIVLFDRKGRELAVRSAYLGRCTNNIAEYRALILGLQTACELNCGTLEIFMDSQLIVRQVQGQYKVKNAGIKPLFAEARALLAKFDNWTITHVPRAENKRADELANRGIDEK